MNINELTGTDGSGTNDPEQQFNYALAIEQLKRQRKIAEQQSDTKMPEGQMVSGWYVAPRGSQYLAAGLEKMLGAYGMYQADQSEKETAAKSQEQVAQLAKALQGSQGGFADNLPAYQQLMNAGPMGQLVAKARMEKDLAGPTYQKLGEGEQIIQFDKNGNQLGVIAGNPKKTNQEKEIALLEASGLSREIAIGIATGAIKQDPTSGAYTDARTGRDVNYGGQPAPTTSFPQATGQQAAPAPTGPTSVPARGQTFTGPTAFPQATGTAPAAAPATLNSAQQVRQDKANAEKLPKVATAQNELDGITTAKQQVADLKGLLAEKDGRQTGLTARTGPVQGPLFQFSKGNQAFDMKAKALTLHLLGGKLGTAISDADRKFIESMNVNSRVDGEVNRAALADLEARLDRQLTAKQQELKGYGVEVSSPTAEPQSTKTAPKAVW